MSAWTWAATLLQSSAVAFKLGVSGSYWYAAGATVQVLIFALVAAKLKSNAPNCTTYLEIVKERWGTTAHLIFMFFAIVTNVLVGSMLILGGSSTVTQLSGMPTLAAIWLTPLSVAIYTLTGGMRATLLADWSHTFVLLIMLLIFAFAGECPVSALQSWRVRFQTEIHMCSASQSTLLTFPMELARPVAWWSFCPTPHTSKATLAEATLL